MIIIYKIVNDINDKVYIGMTSKALVDVWEVILNELPKDGNKTKIQRAMLELGVEHFKIKKLKTIDSTNVYDPIIIALKQQYINKYDSQNAGYNSVYQASKKYVNYQNNNNKFVKYNTYDAKHH